jgi:hypothetical protein
LPTRQIDLMQNLLDQLRAKQIKFVEKSGNPACVPEILVIEDFLVGLRLVVCGKGWQAKTFEKLITGTYVLLKILILILYRVKFEYEETNR